MTEEQRTSTKNNAVTAGLAGGVFVCFCGSALVNLDWTTTQLDAAFAWTTAVFGLGWQVLTVLTLIGALAIAGSPWGAIRLGGRSEPELPYGRWLAIILCTLLAGGGVFWSAAEPMFHFTSPPPTFPGVEAGAAEAVAPALAQAYFHWGFLAWAVVGTLGAITLLVHEERGVPLTPRALLAGFVNEKLLAGPLGSVVDAVAIIAALAGTIGPIGFLGLQLAYAAKALLGAPDGYGTQLVVLGALVTLATVSAVSGIDRGIQFLSRLNVGLALGLATAIVLLGPTAFIFRSFFEALGTYAVALPRLAFFRADPAWLDYWTVFYWGWFLSYAPLMSIFVARISRGRSIREIVLAVAVVAPLLTNFWFSILGGSGIAFELTNAGSVSDALEADGLPAALFAIVEQLPFSGLLIPFFVVLIFVFLATSADSMAYTASMIVSGQSTPPAAQRAFWSILMGVIAAILLAMGEGGIKALQSMIVIAASPVSLLMATCLVSAPLLLWRRTKERSSEMGWIGPSST